MSIVVSVLKENRGHEKRVALDPEVTKKLVKNDFEVLIEAGAGKLALFADADYEKAGGKIVDRQTALTQGNIVVVVNEPGDDTLAALKSGQIIIGLLSALLVPDKIQRLADAKVTAISCELLPRTVSRSQAMDVLSSQASIAGYKATLLASNLYAKYFPMMITAAGTVKPAKVLVLGTGVAGLQAIGTAKRLGTVVSGYDVRAASKGEVESLGATFLTSTVANGAGTGGYARELTTEEHQAQQAELAGFIAQNDIIITTAQVPGRKPPLLVPQTSVDQAQAGTIFIDLAASDLGGNVASSQPFATVTTAQGALIVGASNLASELSNSASQLFAKNVQSIINAFMVDGAIQIDPTDEVFKGLLATIDGEIINARLRKIMNLPDLAEPKVAEGVH
ncbi:NAD(P) transhydrogenase subunit alpha [Loigolactobacillus jiayinensis]|uniref:proton-translocating NAD(P)(+) transhydrogenase n=1 Tax=Loigolactobacillus jiayinensis TaxID=2486016 RepID=A0ABW1RAV3_9LACO|nr:NAD(P) transhydrogenase subunit alpha [Loigolactobacillus jiayinensis]